MAKYPLFVTAGLLAFVACSSQHQHEERLRTLGNQASISSDQFFGRSSDSHQGSRHMPDVSDIKDGVREGVRSVAGKLSSMASGLANTIQVCCFSCIRVLPVHRLLFAQRMLLKRTLQSCVDKYCAGNAVAKPRESPTGIKHAASCSTPVSFCFSVDFGC